MAAASILNNMKDPAIGIDLGTTYCAVAVYVDGKVEIVPNREQNLRHTPSYVSYLRNGTENYGKVAKDQSYRFPEETVYDAKRMIGRPWKDPLLQGDIKNWPFDVKNVNGFAKIKIGTKTRYPQEISAKLLSTFCRHAEQHLDKSKGSIRKAVITVPSYFTEAQRRATIEAGEAANLTVLSIINEPTAAAMAHMSQRRSTEPKTVLIYDLGGGTFDVAIVRIGANHIETLGVDGDTHLGGQDFDQLLAEYCCEEFKIKTGIDLLEKRAEFRSPMTRLRLQCEVAKQALSSSETSFVDVQRIHEDDDLIVSVTRKKFEELIGPLLNKTMEIVERVIKGIKDIQGPIKIDEVIAVGGSTRIPLVLEKLEKFFDGEHIIKCSIDPDEAIAYGAALHAAVLNDNAGNNNFVKVRDITTKTLGVDIVGDCFDPIIRKGHPIPCEITRGYRTSADSQTCVRWILYQGEDKKASNNEKLGEFKLEGFPPRPMGKERFDVTMKIDANGILTITATSRSTKTAESVIVTDDRLRMDRKTIERSMKEVNKWQFQLLNQSCLICNVLIVCTFFNRSYVFKDVTMQNMLTIYLSSIYVHVINCFGS